MKKSVASQKPELSVIILNYNSGGYLSKCLKSLCRSKLNDEVEVIVVDNKSTDQSFRQAQTVSSTNRHLTFKFKSLSSNIGFSRGNNQGVKLISPSSKLVLFLNPDTLVLPNTLQKSINFFHRHSNAAALTCRLILALNHRLQPECHRGFPTPWRSLCYFSGLSKVFPKSSLFNGYFLGHLNTQKTHRIEACVGAFLMVRRLVGENVGWWNEKYFFYGEDLDLCYKLHQKGHALYYYPYCKAYHYQGISSGIVSQSQKRSLASRETKIRSAKASTEAMRIFYQENLIKNYPILTRLIVLSGIKLLESLRVAKAKYSS
jgi:GT2 family glycosyltransferase